jgi:hypothetical protein
MSDGVSLTVPGLDAFLAELRALPAKVQTKVMARVVSAGAAVVQAEIVRRAPEFTGEVSQGHPPPGTLKKAIYRARVPSECTSNLEVWKVAVRKGKAAQSTRRGKSTVNLDAFYATWVEYGHFARVPHKMTKAATAAARAAGTAKWAPAHPFFRPGVAASTNASFAAMRASLERELPLAVAGSRYLQLK